MPRQHENDPDMQTVQQQLHQMSLIVGGLQNAVTTMTDLWRHQENNASAGRALVHQKIDALKDDVGHLVARVDTMGSELAAIKPAAQAFKDETLRAEGAKRLGGYLWGLMLTAAGFSGWGIHEFIAWMSHRGGPPTP